MNQSGIYLFKTSRPCFYAVDTWTHIFYSNLLNARTVCKFMFTFRFHIFIWKNYWNIFSKLSSFCNFNANLQSDELRKSEIKMSRESVRKSEAVLWHGLNLRYEIMLGNVHTYAKNKSNLDEIKFHSKDKNHQRKKNMMRLLEWIAFVKWPKMLWKIWNSIWVGSNLIKGLNFSEEIFFHLNFYIS